MKSSIDNMLSELDNTDADIIIDDKKLSGKEIFNAYSEGNLFNRSIDYLDFNEILSNPIMLKLIQHTFYSHCKKLANIILSILESVIVIERKTPEFNIKDQSSSKCIYCLSENEIFSSEEHVIPESFGVDEIILRGAVCNNCNNKLSKLDQFLSEFEPLSFLRVYNVPLQKKEKSLMPISAILIY